MKTIVNNYTQMNFFVSKMCSQAFIETIQTMDTSPKSEPTLELHSRAAPSVEAHHHVSSPNTGRNSKGRQTIKINKTAHFNFLKSHLRTLLA